MILMIALVRLSTSYRLVRAAAGPPPTPVQIEHITRITSSMTNCLIVFPLAKRTLIWICFFSISKVSIFVSTCLRVIHTVVWYPYTA